MEPATLLLLPGLDGTEVLFGPLLKALPPWIRPRVVTYPARGANGYADLLPLVRASVVASGGERHRGTSTGGRRSLRCYVSALSWPHDAGAL